MIYLQVYSGQLNGTKVKMSELDALLVNPISARMIPAFIPHGLLYIGAYAIKCGYNIAVLDRNVEDNDIKEILLRTRPKVVGLGCLTGTSIDDAIYVSKIIKELDPSIKIVWGGIHTTLCPDSVLQEKFVDYVVIGDGEMAFTRILDNVIRKNISLETIDNLGYKAGVQLIYNKRVNVDLDSLPLPAWHLINVEKYIRKKFYANRVITINTSRGCPYKCSFCCVPTVHLGKWRGVSAERIIENLKYLIDNYQIDGFQVDDDEFDIKRTRVLELCGLLKINNINLKWSHFSRINIIREDVLNREIECGLSLVEFGVESGSPRMLKFLNKGQTVEQIIAVYKLCKKLRLRASALFMIGLPTEESSDLMETVELIKRIDPHLTICTIYRPYPGTELFDYCVDKGLFSYENALEKVGGIYEGMINTSNIEDKLLLKVKSYFDRRNIYYEIKFILTRMKIGLMIYYFKYYFMSYVKRFLKGKVRRPNVC